MPAQSLCLPDLLTALKKDRGNCSSSVPLTASFWDCTSCDTLWWWQCCLFPSSSHETRVPGSGDTAMQASRQGRKSHLQISRVCFHGLLHREKWSAEGEAYIEKIKGDREERVNRHAFWKESFSWHLKGWVKGILPCQLNTAVSFKPILISQLRKTYCSAFLNADCSLCHSSAQIYLSTSSQWNMLLQRRLGWQFKESPGLSKAPSAIFLTCCIQVSSGQAMTE